MATGTSEFIDATTASAFIPQVWSREALVAREKALVFARMVNRVYEGDVANYGDTIHVPSRGHLTTQTKSRSANAATIFETVTESNSDITIGTWTYSAIALETATKRQTNRDLLTFYAPEQGYALALDVDTTLAALPSSASNSVGALTVDLGYSDLLRAIQYLDDALAPRDGRMGAVAPATEVSLLKLDHFVHADYAALVGPLTGKTAVDQAYFKSFMQIPFFASTNVNGSNAAGHTNVLLQKEALALVMMLSAETHAMYDINFFASKVAVENLYGSAIMRNDHMVKMLGA